MCEGKLHHWALISYVQMSQISAYLQLSALQALMPIFDSLMNRSVPGLVLIKITTVILTIFLLRIHSSDHVYSQHNQSIIMLMALFFQVHQ